MALTKDRAGQGPRMAIAGLRNAFVDARNAISDLLPGERPAWVVVELEGSFPARSKRRRLLPSPTEVMRPQEVSLEAFERRVATLAAAPWLEGVVLRFGALQVDLTTATAVRSQLDVLRRAGKRLVAFATHLDTTTYLLACGADEIVTPESAEFFVHGLALRTTFMGEALERVGVTFDKLAIAEFKNAGDTFARKEMSEAQRLQSSALLDRYAQFFVETVARSRNEPPEAVHGWLDEGVTSARRALELGMIDRVAYEDEALDRRSRSLAEAARFVHLHRADGSRGRVAVVSLRGTIVTGKSSRSPLPIPIVGETAGSETLQRALRAADEDPATKAIVFHVDSGGGSALASDLIWREIVRIGAKKPVVAVMGSVAASGGYYVLTHARRVIAAPTTITGSIGVLAAKFVTSGLNEKIGLNPEVLQRGRFANAFGTDHAFDDEERAHLQRYIEEVYERFTTRVAEGRGLALERVREVAKGRIWSGVDALELGLVDELGDVSLAVARAKEMAGLPAAAPTWNVDVTPKMLLPAQDDPSTLVRTLAPLLQERALLMHPVLVQVR